MDITNRDWSHLPPELLRIILQFAATKQLKIESCNIALVCKAWKITAQEVAYSNIALKRLSQFNKFHDIIIHSTHLGIKIKALYFVFYTHLLEESDKVTVSNRLTSLLTTSLPNLEILKMLDLHTCVPTLNTLLNSHLKKLKRLPNPINNEAENEYENYFKCVSIMKDRLENLYITRGDFFYLGERQHEKTNIGLQRLYDNLHQFSNLVDIKASLVTSDGTQVLEYIVESCRSLKNIEIRLKASSDQPNHRPPIPEYVPRSTIKSLIVSLDGGRNDHNLPWYIMHKFSRLQHLSLDLYEDNPLHDDCLINQFLEYLSTIDEFFISGLSTNQSNLIETVGNFWEKTSKLGSEYMHVEYPADFLENVKTKLRATRRSGGRTNTTLEYPGHTDFDWKSFFNCIKRSGKYIGAIFFGFDLEDLRLDKTIPGNFFYDTLTNCPNLKDLQFNGCSFRDTLHSAIIFDTRFSINELSFQYCNIQPAMFEQLSPLLYKINKLRIFATSAFISENGPHNEEDPSLLIITMPKTDIKCIAFDAEGLGEIIYIKVYVSTDEKCYYYKFVDIERDHRVQISTEQDFVAVNNEQHAYITCLTKPTLETREI